MVTPFLVSCKTGTLPHVAPVTAVTAFDRSNVSPYDVSTDGIGPGSIVVVCRCGVASFCCKFSVQLCTTAVGPLTFQTILYHY